MSKILIAYSTVDGHTRHICERLQAQFEQAGHEVALRSLADHAELDTKPYDKVVVGASIRYGKFRPHLYSFVRKNLAGLQAMPSAFFSVNLVARKPGKDTPEGSPYTQRFKTLSGWQPKLMAVFAGRLSYPRYRLVDRHMIRLIMWLTQGPTDLSASIDFTDWAKVQAFGKDVQNL